MKEKDRKETISAILRARRSNEFKRKKRSSKVVSGKRVLKVLEKKQDVQQEPKDKSKPVGLFKRRMKRKKCGLCG